MEVKPNSTPPHDFSYYLSKGVIILPLIIIIMAVFFKVQQSVSVLNQKVVASPTPSISVPQTQAPVQASPTGEKFNLDGPYSCNYIENKQSIKVYVKNKNISVQMVKTTAENVIVKGDCAYKWDPVKGTGEKMCGISQYFSLFDMLSSMSGGGLDIKTILGMVQSTRTKQQDFSDAFMQNAAATCKKQPVTDSVFIVPSWVKFKAVQSSDPTASSSAGLNMFGLP